MNRGLMAWPDRDHRQLGARQIGAAHAIADIVLGIGDRVAKLNRDGCG